VLCARSGYSLKSWYVTLDQGVIETPEVLCNPGDVIFGNMTYLKKSALGGKWYVGGTGDETVCSFVFCVSKYNVCSSLVFVFVFQIQRDSLFCSSLFLQVASSGLTAAFTAERVRLKAQPWAYTTVECYGCIDCTYLPTNSLYFTAMTGSYQSSNIPFVWRS
jgi:hypothetical protein